MGRARAGKVLDTRHRYQVVPRVEDGSTLFGVMYQTIEHVLKTMPEETMAIAHARLVRLDCKTSYSEAVLGVEEAVACFDIHGVDQLTQPQRKAHHTLLERQGFAEEYRRSESTSPRLAVTSLQGRRGIGQAPSRTRLTCRRRSATTPRQR